MASEGTAASETAVGPTPSAVTDRLLSRAGPLIAGLLVAFSLPPWGWWPLTIIGIALLDRCLADATTRGHRFAQGAVFAAAWLFVATLWMWDLTPPGYIIAGVVFSLYYAVGMALLPSGDPTAQRIALVAMFVLVAVARWSWPFGGVPLATLAMTQADGPLGPTVRTFGALTLVALVPLVGVALAAAVERAWRFVAGAGGVLLIAVILTAIAPFGEAFATLDVAVIQGGGPQNTRAITSDDRLVFERHVEATEKIDGAVDLILWPENVVDVEGRLQDNIEFEELGALAAQMGAPIIPGMTEGFRGDDPHYTNASVLMSTDGGIIDRYDKVRRVPYGEYVPFRSIVENAAPDFLPYRDARPGTGPAVLESDLFPTLGISISWEIFFDTRARDAISNGGTILLNPTNGSSYWLTIVQSQQVASSRLRAMETGRWVLQAAPTGFSAVITPQGDVIDRSGVSEQKVIQETVELREGLTWAVRFGRWPMLLMAIVAFFGAHVLARRPASASANVTARRPS